MIIRCTMYDNDFSVPMLDAGYDLLNEITNGFNPEEAVLRCQALIKKSGIVEVQNRLTVGILGQHMALNGARGRFNRTGETNLGTILKDYEDTLKYFKENIKVKVVKGYKADDENYEVIYIDFLNQIVHQQ